MNKYLKIMLLMAVALLLAACAPETPSPQETEEVTLPAVMSGYPVPENSSGSNTAYPLPNSSAEFVYPAPGEENVVQPASSAIPFQFDKPIVPGATQVTGTGTPGVPVALINVTMMGEVLAETVIEADGSFRFDVQPLQAGTRIGLILGNLDGTSWVPENFTDPGFNGDDAMNVPLVGFVWDSVLVK